MSTDDELRALLRAVLTADEADSPLDNETLARALGWNLEDVAEHLLEAKTRSLIWGHREARKPSPWFSELELTVQGKRLLRGAT